MVLTCIARATSNLSLCDVSAQAGLESAQETSGARGGKYKPVGRYAIYCIVGTSGTFFVNYSLRNLLLTVGLKGNSTEREYL